MAKDIEVLYLFCDECGFQDNMSGTEVFADDPVYVDGCCPVCATSADRFISLSEYTTADAEIDIAEMNMDEERLNNL
jgi:hypothetical protein